MAAANDLRPVQVRSVYLCVYMGDVFYGVLPCVQARASPELMININWNFGGKRRELFMSSCKFFIIDEKISGP